MAGNRARRYAQAIFSVAGNPEDIERVEHELGAFRKILAELPSLGRVVVHPGVPADKRKAVLDQVLDLMDCHVVSRGAIGLLVVERELRDLSSVIDTLGKLREDKLTIATAQVPTAYPLDNGDRPAWEAALAKAAGKRVRIEYSTDSSLIGGAVARIGSVLYDGSVSGSLLRIRQSLLGD